MCNLGSHDSGVDLVIAILFDGYWVYLSGNLSTGNGGKEPVL